MLGMGKQAARERERRELAARIDRELGSFDPAHLRAVMEVPRERFVRPEYVSQAYEDTPLPLDDAGLSTISAPHAYCLSFRLLGLARGDHLLELGTGYGYGAALASHIVGTEGRVISVEIDRQLAEHARQLLADRANVIVRATDAVHATQLFRGANKISCTFAIEELPGTWLGSMDEGAVLVAPVGPTDQNQRLVRVERRDGELMLTDHGGVRYVPNRSSVLHS